MDGLDDTFDHYLGQCRALLDRGVDDTVLCRRLAPDMDEAGFHLAVAMRFAARAVAPMEAPDIPSEYTQAALRTYADDIAGFRAGRTTGDLTGPVHHVAGEAELTQDPQDFLLRFALPNMIFHLSVAYAVARSAGVPLGKADFDGLHVYR
ncbi:MAG: DUF1993 family protein [Pseudomonadota bacterium]